MQIGHPLTGDPCPCTWVRTLCSRREVKFAQPKRVAQILFFDKTEKHNCAIFRFFGHLQFFYSSLKFSQSFLKVLNTFSPTILRGLCKKRDTYDPRCPGTRVLQTINAIFNICTITPQLQVTVSKGCVSSRCIG